MKRNGQKRRRQSRNWKGKSGRTWKTRWIPTAGWKLSGAIPEISELDETILFELVDRIEVGDTQKVNGQRICEVKVYYRYVGNVDGALAQERGRIMAKQYKVGIYCRLSVDDASNSAKAKGYIPSDESVSIENQYEILSKFVMLNGWIEVKTYQDDGYSGGNFQRPGFLEMLEDARHGLINLILLRTFPV